MSNYGFGNIKLFAGSGCPELAQKISDYMGVPLSNWDIINFPNENIWIRLGGSVRGKDVYIIQSHARPVHRSIMEMLIAIDCLKRDSAGRITVVVPYMAYSQSDQKTEPRVPITARLLADMIETAGADRWITLDLHAGQIQGFYKIPGDSLTARHIIVDYFKTKDLSNTTVVTTDLGFAKGGRKYADQLGLPLAFVEKRRFGSGEDAGREALTLIGEVSGRNVIIVDDLVDTAGSILQAVNVVKEIYEPFTPEEVAAKIAELLRPDDLKADLEIIFQSLDGLHKACPEHMGDWYFSGDYPTPGGNKVVNRAFMNFMEGKNVRAY